MKSKLSIILSLASALAFSSCAPNATAYGPKNEAQRNAVNGAAAGALLGGIVGHQSGKALEGAAVGAAAGGGGGYLYGQNKQAQ